MGSKLCLAKSFCITPYSSVSLSDSKLFACDNNQAFFRNKVAKLKDGEYQ